MELLTQYAIGVLGISKNLFCFCKVADEKDKRIQRIYLTDYGRELHREVEKIRKEVNAVMVQGMTPEEVDHLKDQILRMQENLEKMPGSMEIKGYFREGEQ